MTREPNDSNSVQQEDIARQLNLLEQKQRAFGCKHKGVANTLRTIARLCRKHGLFEEGIKYQIRVTKGYENDGDKEIQVEDYNLLGSLYYEAKQFDHAKLAFEQALERSISRKQRRESTSNLAYCLHAQRKWEDAARMFRSVIELIENETEDLDHPWLARPFMFLGEGFRERSMFNQALQMYSRALNIVDKHLGPIHLDIAKAIDNLGHTYYLAKRYPEAEAMFRRSLEIRQSLLDPETNEDELRKSWDNISMAINARRKRIRKRKTKRT